MTLEEKELPIIHVGPLIAGQGDSMAVGHQIRNACTRHGFFYIIGHGISEDLQQRLEQSAKDFFALPNRLKQSIAMSKGGKAWRGYFSLGDELTSGKPDLKEGLYFGSELDNDHPKVQADTYLHGANLFPSQLPEMKAVVLEYIDEMTQLGHALMRGIALSLGLNADYFKQHLTYDPLTLFRIFHYPPHESSPLKDASWGVGEHTDYGVLTILKQDSIGGLQVKTGNSWIDAPPIPGTFVCNIGDMLDKMTGGYYRSTAHRVLNSSNKGRFSYPFFFDPNFDVEVKPIDLSWVQGANNHHYERWDEEDLYGFKGTYGSYILGKIGKVFPGLNDRVKGQ